MPTYGDLIELYNKYESDQDQLCTAVSERFPSVANTRPGRLYDSISRIVAPTKKALNGTVKLAEGGSPLKSYCKRIWEPRVRICQTLQGAVIQ